MIKKYLSWVGGNTERRYIALIFICLFSLGFMGVNDAPGSLQLAVMKSLNLTTYQFSILYSSAAWPSVFASPVSITMDRYLGVGNSVIAFAIVLTCGQGVFLIGMFLKYFEVLIIGRMLYGLGADSLMACLNTFILHWFTKSDELSLVFALVTSLPWAGFCLAYSTSNRLYDVLKEVYSSSESLGLSFVPSTCVAALMAIFSFVLVLLYQTTCLSDLPPSKATDNGKIYSNIGQDLVQLPFIFWIISMLFNIYFLTVMTVLMLSQELFTTKYKLSVNTANDLTSVFGLVTFMLSSPLAFLVDKTGRHLSFVSLAVIFSVISLGLITFTMSNPFAAVVLLSISYSMMTAAYFPLIGCLVDKKLSVTAYTIAQGGSNVVYAFGTLMVGYIATTYGYTTLVKCYFYSLTGSIPIWIVVWICNYLKCSSLDINSKRDYNSEKSLGKEDNQKEPVIAEAICNTTPPLMKKNNELGSTN